GDSLANRQSNARQQISRPGGTAPSSRVGTTGVGERAGAARGQSGVGAGAGAGNLQRGGGADQIGQRDLSRGSGANRDAFGGGSQGYNGAGARANSSRGSSSV